METSKEVLARHLKILCYERIPGKILNPIDHGHYIDVQISSRTQGNIIGIESAFAVIDGWNGEVNVKHHKLPLEALKELAELVETFPKVRNYIGD